MQEVSVFRDHRSAELVVDAGAHDVRAQVGRVCIDVGREGDRRGKRCEVGAGRGVATEVDIEILGLHRPAVHQRILCAAADGPTHLCLRDRCGFRSRCERIGEAEIALHIGHGETTGDIEQPVVRGDADARAEREKPVARHRGVDGEAGGRAAGVDSGGAGRLLQSEIIEVGLKTINEIAHLPVVAGGQAAGEAGAVDPLIASDTDGSRAARREISGR